jgi:DNA-binding XRE family transcriptional regulator
LRDSKAGRLQHSQRAPDLAQLGSFLDPEPGVDYEETEARRRLLEPLTEQLRQIFDNQRNLELEAALLLVAVRGLASCRFGLEAMAEHKLSQRALAERIGVSQPRIVKLESGEHNPEIDTIINAVRRLGIEFVLDVSPADRKPVLVTARAQRQGAIAHDDVSVVTASSLAT